MQESPGFVPAADSIRNIMKEKNLDKALDQTFSHAPNG
jgi:hypothetical protein